MPKTYESITSTTLTSTSTSVSFTSIPGTYTDLILVIQGSFQLNGSGINLQYNSDTGTNYSRTRITGDGSTAASSRTLTSANASVAYLGTSQSTTIMHFLNYANTTTYKTALGRGGSGADGLVVATAHLWRSTAAITTITVSDTATFTTSTTFSLYGIKAA
jgi:hypothetical protein